jgi:hypothetical protein
VASQVRPPGQVLVVAAGHAPALQAAAAVSVAPVQLCERQVVLGYVQSAADEALHEPVQRVPAPAQAPP